MSMEWYGVVVGRALASPFTKNAQDMIPDCNTAWHAVSEFRVCLLLRSMRYFLSRPKCPSDKHDNFPRGEVCLKIVGPNLSAYACKPVELRRIEGL